MDAENPGGLGGKAITILSVPHRIQRNPTSCVPASVQMVLAYYGIEKDEITIGHLLELSEEGTSILNVELLEHAEIGATVRAGEIQESEIRQFLDRGIPLIAGVMTGNLPYWNSNRPHSVVVIGYDEQLVYLNDPKFSEAPQRVSWDDFRLAWGRFGRFAAIIRPMP